VGFQPREEASGFVVPLSMFLCRNLRIGLNCVTTHLIGHLIKGYTNLQQQEICVILVVTIVGFVAILHALIVRLILSIKCKGDKRGIQMESCRELGTCQAEY
jgi:hypothetical protein